MKVRFYIEKRRGKDGKLLIDKRPIFMTVSFHGKRVLITTKKKVDLKWWDQEKQRVLDIHPDATVMNAWLNSLENTAGLVWKGMNGVSDTPGRVKFHEEFERIRPRFSGGFFDVLFIFMEEGSKRWSDGTYKKVRGFYNQLRIFEKETNDQINFNTITADFLTRFQEFQRNKKRGEVTILKMVNTLVWFMNWATEQGYNVYYEYRQFYKLLGQPEKKEMQDFHYLEWKELMLLYNYTSEEPRKHHHGFRFLLGIRLPHLLSSP